MLDERFEKRLNRKYKWWGDVALELITSDRSTTNHLLWLGRWNEQHREDMFTQLRPIKECKYTSTGEWQKARELLLDFGRITVNAVIDIYDARTEMCHELYQYSLTHTDMGKPIPPTPTHVLKQVENNIKFYIETQEVLRPISKDITTLSPTANQVE